MKRLLAMAICVVACTPDATRLAPTPWPLQALERPSQPVIIAHRGGAGMGPEATLDTMRRSLAAGASVLELDVHLTADGIPVLLHDHTVDRTTDGTGEVMALDYDTIRSLDAGGGARIPHLSEPLRAFPETPFILELKGDHPDLIPEVISVLRDEDALSRVILASFWTDRLEAVRALDEAPATGLSTAEVMEWLWHEDAPAFRPPAAFAQVPPEVGGYAVVTPQRLARAAELGLSVQVWTINDPEEAKRLASLGVSGILTDVPDQVSLAVSPRSSR